MFIELTRENDKEILINVNKIKNVYSSNEYRHYLSINGGEPPEKAVIVTDDDRIVVKERYQEVKKLISEAIQ